MKILSESEMQLLSGGGETNWVKCAATIGLTAFTMIAFVVTLPEGSFLASGVAYGAYVWSVDSMRTSCP